MIGASLLLMYLILSHVFERAGSTVRRNTPPLAPVVPISNRNVVSRLGGGAANANGTAAVSVLEGMTVPLISGGVMDLGASYLGHVLLVVNVASKCGFTDTNYRELEALQLKFRKQKFSVLAFPCDQFGHQEPGSPKEIEYFARRTKKATFPLFDKVEVNGPNAAPFFVALKASLQVDEIKWNFGKFLIGRDGVPLRFYDHNFPFPMIKKHIEAVLESR